MAPKRRRGPDLGIDAWTVAMETDAKRGPLHESHWPKPVEKMNWESRETKD